MYNKLLLKGKSWNNPVSKLNVYFVVSGGAKATEVPIGIAPQRMKQKLRFAT